MAAQLITFQLGEQLLGVDIMAVREIRAWSPATPLPNVPPHVRGVVNLRGVVLPVIDLRRLLCWGATDPTARHVIIVLQIGAKLQGLIVDAVNDIVPIDRDGMQPPPDLARTAEGRLIEGILMAGGRMVMVLALESLDRAGDEQRAIAA